MNLWDVNFWVFGPFVFWVLAGAVIFHAFTQLKTSKKIMKVLEKIFSEIGKENGELKKATSELQVDTFQLTNIIISLKNELENTRKAIVDWHESMRKIYFWIPFGGDKK